MLQIAGSSQSGGTVAGAAAEGADNPSSSDAAGQDESGPAPTPSNIYAALRDLYNEGQSLQDNFHRIVRLGGGTGNAVRDCKHAFCPSSIGVNMNSAHTWCVA